MPVQIESSVILPLPDGPINIATTSIAKDPVTANVRCCAPASMVYLLDFLTSKHDFGCFCILPFIWLGKDS